MGLRYITGRASSGKTSKIYEEIELAISSSVESPLLLLVPEQFTLQAESDIIRRTTREGIMQVEVLSFQRLAHRILSETGGIKRIPISQTGKVMRLRSIFESYPDEFTFYSKVSKREGFLSMCADMIDEMKKSGADEKSIESAIENVGDESLSRKLREIGFLYSKYTQSLSQSYIDEHDRLKLLCEGIESSRMLEGAVVWIDGFSGFSKTELDVIISLAQKVKKVNISMTLDDETAADYDLFAPSRDALKGLTEMASKEGISQGRKIVLRKPDKAKELLHLEKNLYAYPYSKFDGNLAAVKLFAARDRYSEVENCAAAIVGLARDKGYRWNDVSIVTGDMQSYSRIVKRVFSEYGIPFFIDEKRSVMNNPIIRFITRALDMAVRDFRHEDVFNCLKTGFAGIERDEVEWLENYCLKYGIRSRSWIREFKMGDENERKQAEQLRVKFIGPFERLSARISQKQTITDFVKSLYLFMEECEMHKRIEEWIEELSAMGRLEYVSENSQIWNIAMDIFDQLVEIMGDSRLDRKEFSSILTAGLTEYKIGIIPPAMDQVTIGSLERSKSHEIKALFVLGANDGIMPSGFKDDGLFQDEEKLMLKSCRIKIGVDSLTASEQEKFSIYTSFSKPSEFFCISYAISDEEGRAMRPSMLVERLRKLFPDLVADSDISGEQSRLELVSSPRATLRHLAANLRGLIDDGKMDELWWDVYSWYAGEPEWRQTLEFIKTGLFHRNQQAYIGEKFASRLYGTPLKSSISRIEKFANCPFAHFVSYALSPRERMEYSVSMPDIGTLFHNSVEEFAKELSMEGLEWSSVERGKSDEIIEKVIDRIVCGFGSKVLESSHRYKYLVGKIKRVGKRAAWTLVEHIKRGEFVPLGHEVEFTSIEKDNSSGKISIPPIVIELAGGNIIELEGRIDRVDILDDNGAGYVKIIDYKSGSKKFALSDAYYGLQIQLIAYMDALLENSEFLKYDELHPAGMLYFRIDDPMVDFGKMEEEDIEREILKKLKMNGIVLKDVRIVRAMDSEIGEGGYSDIVPAQIKNDGSLSARSSALEEEELQSLIRHIKNIIGELGTEILKGNVRIHPCKDGNDTSCSFCKFSSICQFDTSFEDNEYRNIQKLSDSQVIERICGKDKGGAENEKVDS